MKLTWRQIEAFRAIMLTGTITRAAEFLSISQPAVSTLLANLELELGYKLFRRQQGRLVVTREAETLYPEIERSFVGLDEITRVAHAIGGMQTGILRVATMPALAGDLLADAIASFVKDRPNVSLVFEVRPRLTVLNWIAANRCDVGISSEPTDAPGIRSQFLSTDETVCLLPPGHKLSDKRAVTPRDLDGENLIGLPQETLLDRRLEQLLAEARSVPVRRVETRTSQALWQLVARGVGVGIATHFRLSGRLAEAVTVRPFEPSIPIDVSLLFPRHRPTSKLASAFCRHIEALCRETV